MKQVVLLIRRGDDPCKIELVRDLGKLAEFYSRYGEWQRAAQCYLELQLIYKEQKAENSRMYADLLWKDNRWWDSLQVKLRAASILSKARGQ